MTIVTALPHLLFAPMAFMILASGIAKLLKSRKVCLAISAIALLELAAASAYVLLNNAYLSIGNYIYISPFACFFIMLFSICMLFVETIAYSYSKYYIEFSFLAGLSFIGMFMVAATRSILPIFVGLELVSAATALMILLEGKHRAEAAIKFFIVSSLSVALFSFAIASLFPYNPTLSLSQLSSSSDYLLFLSLGIFIAALGFEGALFPFNLWIPDVYQGAPTFVTALMAGLNKKVAFLALIEVLFLVFFAYATAFSPVLEILAVLTMFFGNLLAIAQSNVKRMFAYSSISQAGYILIGLAAAKATGISASLFYIFAHALMIIGAFAIVLFLESYNIKSIEDYTALYSKNGFIAIALTLIMLSMAGMPPLIGFFGKFLLFSSAFYSHLPLLALLGVINSFISIYYYAKVINATFAKKKARPIIASRYVLAVVASIVILIIILGIYPQPLIYLASSAAASLKYI